MRRRTAAAAINGRLCTGPTIRASVASPLTILHRMQTAIHTPDRPNSAFSSQRGLNIETPDLKMQAIGHAGDIACQPDEFEIAHQQRIDDLLEV
jgi:hypothetical protein